MALANTPPASTAESSIILEEIDYQALFDLSLDACFVYLLEDGRILAANSVAQERYGFNQSEFQSMCISDLSAPDLRGEVPSKLKELRDQGQLFEWRHQLKDGSEITVEVSAQAFDHHGLKVVLGTARDISARKSLELELQDQQHLLERIVATGPGTVYLFDLTSLRTHYFNPEWYRVLGYALEDVQGWDEDLTLILHPEDIDKVRASDRAWKTAKRGDTREIEYRVRDKSGEWRWMLSRETPFNFDDQGRVAQILGIAHDVSTRKRLDEERQMFYSLANNSKEFTGMADLDFKPWYANQAALKLLGLADLEALSKITLHDILFPEDRDYILGEFLPHVTQVGNDETEVRFRNIQTGEAIWVLYNVFALTDSDGKSVGWATVSRDITERKFAETLLAGQNQVLEMIATGSPLKQTLGSLIEFIEKQAPGMQGSILLLDDDGLHLRHGAAPSLPREYNELVDGIAIGPSVGSCGTAVFRKESVYVENIESDPLWEDFKELAVSFGLHACWSTPILDAGGEVLGTFAMYFRETGLPDANHLRMIETSVQAASIAISRYRQEQTMLQSEARYRLLFEQAPDGIVITDDETNYIDVNARACEMLGLSRDQLLTMKSREMVASSDLSKIDSALEILKKEQNLHREFKVRQGDGSYFDADVIATTMPDGNNLSIMRDITERKQNEARIAYLANFDALTGLANRSQLDHHLDLALAQARRNQGNLALMFIDIDHFKDINDTLGHSIGDAFLVEVANRLRGILRSEDTAARLGGDEFILMLPNADADGAASVAQKILEEIAEPCRIEQHDLVVTTSIGIALYPDDGIDLDSLSRSADTAMYRAKREGRNGYRFFTSEMQLKAIRNMTLLSALRNALALDQLELHYQPQISIGDERITGAEALLRWNHPELGMVSPGEFIPVAEDSGLILPIGEWVLQTAVRQLKHWLDLGHPPITMAVNLSAVQFRHASLTDMVTRILQQEGVPGELLELELTEGVTMNDPQSAIAIMNKLYDLGIRMSIDDFGTGYSSLGYLKKFKAYKLKIDQSFVRDISTDKEDKAIVAAIISMAKSLGLQTIAEGVETCEQLAYLREQGCDEAQGYFYSKPLIADDFENLMVAGELPGLVAEA